MSYEDRLNHLQHGLDILIQALHSKQIPDISEISYSEFQTWGFALTTTCLALVLALPKSRKLLLETVEAIVTIACLIFLIGIVIGLPFGTAFIGYKGLVFLSAALLRAFPMLGALVDNV
ncbi:hypothetical protein CEUSTIGMA_g683.t1 [Chlamydomonas eustigma]|uniref:Uncharacterized protein n=1 Tax=Chlamydomonas eustigma TaxID=1157962 RepID=A0A250WRQ8_9CHLO|nr:hypothetical protein CEUSTIGMA_g683.t1 [Chlamydomonas eustigma]|eukprot:GAX73230.1 hypothetical protein CEUSTIGMA_g683.t1 [Chlamydomonas eustigma]